MTALFSCAAYHRYEELVNTRKKLATVINHALADKLYGSICFLVVQFSALTLIGEEAPEIDNGNTISMIAKVKDTSPAHLSHALMKSFDNEVVPEAMRSDLKAVFEKEGWL